MRKRIFIANDASFLSTGYGVYGKEIISRLHNSDKFEVAELGCFADISNSKIKNIPWKFYPNAVANTDSRIEQYKANNLNQFGLWRFNRCLIDFKPHIVFDVRDYWMYSYQENSPYKKYFNWVIMPTTDSAPPKVDWLYTFSNADVVVPYTQWAKKVLSDYCGRTINLFPKVANAGINPNEFFPIKNKSEHKIKLFGFDASVTGLVMRNQKRKLFADILLAYKQYLEELKQSGKDDLRNRSILYLHTSYPEEAGWDFPSLLLEFGLVDKTYFSYSCRSCNHYFPSRFQTGLTVCPKCKTRSANMSGPMYSVSTDQLNEIYNAFDIFVQYAICEGFGMPQVEAAACGVPIASVDYSAMTEIVENLGGIKIPVIRLFREMETNADRAYPDIDATTKILYDFFTSHTKETWQNYSDSTRSKCLDTYTWDHVYRVWEECFDSINIHSKPKWTDKVNNDTFHNSVKVPPNLSSKDFVKYIINEVIAEPDMIKTAHCQSLIRDLSSALIAKNGSITSMDKNAVVQNLEAHLNNKIVCEQMRSSAKNIAKEDFI